MPGAGVYYHYKHDPNGPLNNYAYCIYGVGHHTEDDCRPEDAFMQVYRRLYETAYAYRDGGMFDLRPRSTCSTNPSYLISWSHWSPSGVALTSSLRWRGRGGAPAG
jgi:hypothetical protein